MLSLTGRWWTLPMALGVVVALFAWAYYPVAAVQYRQTRERAQLAAELDSLKARNERLRKQVDRLKTPAGVEDYARSQLGLVKKGENVVVVVDGDEDAEAAAAAAPPVIDSDETTASPAGAWTAFLDLVFGVE
jgi:cell division protein FtsL